MNKMRQAAHMSDLPWVVKQHKVQIRCVQVDKGAAHLSQGVVEAVVSWVQFCGQKESCAWCSTLLYGLSN